MKSPDTVFDADAANVIGYRTIHSLSDLPPFSDETVRKYGDRLIWNEMLAAGLITPRQQALLTEQGDGITLGDLIEIELKGQVNGRPSTLWSSLRRVPTISDKQLLDIGNFIRAAYGYAPVYFKTEDKEPLFSPPENQIDVSDLDTELTDQLAQSINFSELDVPEKALTVLNENNIHTVGDYVVLSSTTLLEKGIPAGSLKKIEAAIEAQTGFAKSALVKNKVATQAVRWKYAVMKASMQKMATE